MIKWLKRIVFCLKKYRINFFGRGSHNLTVTCFYTLRKFGAIRIISLDEILFFRLFRFLQAGHCLPLTEFKVINCSN